MSVLIGFVATVVMIGGVRFVYGRVTAPTAADLRAEEIRADAEERLSARVAFLHDVNLTPSMTFDEIKAAMRDPDVKLVHRFDPRGAAFAHFYDLTVEVILNGSVCDAARTTCGAETPVQIAIRRPFPGTLLGIRLDASYEEVVRHLRKSNEKVQEYQYGCFGVFRNASDERPQWVVSRRENEIAVFDERVTVSRSFPAAPLFGVPSPSPPPGRFCEGRDRVIGPGVNGDGN